MAYGSSSYGSGMYGSTDFTVFNQYPEVNTINILRAPTIAFNIISSDPNIDASTINVYVMGYQMISNGAFTSNANGVIDDSDLSNISVILTSLITFPPTTVIVVHVAAMTLYGDVLLYGNTWAYTTAGETTSYNSHITRSYNKTGATSTSFDTSSSPSLTVVSGIECNEIYWTDIVGAKSYRLYSSTNINDVNQSNIDEAFIIAEDTPNIIYTHIGLEIGTTYYYVVVALNYSNGLGNLSLVESGTPVAP